MGLGQHRISQHYVVCWFGLLIKHIARCISQHYGWRRKIIRVSGMGESTHLAALCRIEDLKRNRDWTRTRWLSASASSQNMNWRLAQLVALSSPGLLVLIDHLYGLPNEASVCSLRSCGSGTWKAQPWPAFFHFRACMGWLPGQEQG
jgi:hypothetical protein